MSSTLVHEDEETKSLLSHGPLGIGVYQEKLYYIIMQVHEATLYWWFCYNILQFQQLRKAQITIAKHLRCFLVSKILHILTQCSVIVITVCAMIGMEVVQQHPKCDDCDSELLQRLGGQGRVQENEVHHTSHLGSWNHTEVLLRMEG